MDLRRKLAAQDVNLLPVLKLIPNSATDEQIYFYIWVQEETIASRIPIPLSRNQRCVEVVKKWIIADVANPSDYGALKLRPLSYTTTHYTELFKYCANRKQIFTSKAIKEIERVLGFTTPAILYNLLETMKSYPTYQQYALAIAYFLHIDGAYYNKPVFLNFVADGPSPTTSGESARSRWAKWGDTIPRIAVISQKEPPPEQPTAPLKPVYMQPPNINQAARVGFSINARRSGESSTIKITKPQKTGEPGIKMRSDNYTTAPQPLAKPRVEEPVVESSDLIRVVKAEPRTEQLEMLTAKLLARIEEKASWKDQLEELLVADISARLDSMERALENARVGMETKFSAHVEKAQGTKTKLSTRLGAIEQVQKSVETKLSTRLQTVEQAQKRVEETLISHVHTVVQVEKLSTQLQTVEQAQKGTKEKLATQLQTVEQLQKGIEAKLSTQLEQAQKGIEKVSTRLQAVEQVQKRVEKELSKDLREKSRLQSIERAQKQRDSHFSTRLESVERRMLELDAYHHKTLQQLKTRMDTSTEFAGMYPWSRIDFNHARIVVKYSNPELLKIVLLRELLVKYVGFCS